MNIRKEYLKITAPKISGKKTLQKISRTFKNPTVQFILFGAAMIILMFAATIIPNMSSLKNEIAQLLVSSVASIGFCLLLGYSGLASLGTAGFFTVGGFLTYYGLAQWNVTIVPAILIAGIVSIVLGVIVGFISLRIEGIYLAILTLCLSEVIVKILRALKSSGVMINVYAGGALSFFGIPVTQMVIYVVLAIVLTLLLIMTANLIKSPTGRAMQAMKSSTSAAQAMGISLMKYRLIAFILATFFASVAGCFYIMCVQQIDMNNGDIIKLVFSLNVLGAVIIGGAKSLWGTLFGTFFVFSLQPIVLSRIPFFAENPDISVLVTGVLMIVVCMFFPGGFAEILLRIRIAIMNGVKKWRVRKYGIEE